MASVSLKSARLAAIVAASMLAGGALTGAAFAYQPHMHSALSALQAARTQLSLAIPDKDGYRTRAAGFVDDAIGAVEDGIRAGAR